MRMKPIQIKQDKMQKGLYVQWTEYMLMKNSDQGKYGSLMTSLTTQFSMGTNQYPKDVMAAVDILTNHRFNKKEPKNNNQRNRNRNNGNTALTKTTESSFNQEALKKATCYTVAARKATTQINVQRRINAQKMSGQ
jgi:hypothetical protein